MNLLWRDCGGSNAARAGPQAGASVVTAAAAAASSHSPTPHPRPPCRLRQLQIFLASAAASPATTPPADAAAPQPASVPRLLPWAEGTCRQARVITRPSHHPMNEPIQPSNAPPSHFIRIRHPACIPAAGGACRGGKTPPHPPPGGSCPAPLSFTYCSLPRLSPALFLSSIEHPALCYAIPTVCECIFACVPRALPNHLPPYHHLPATPAHPHLHSRPALRHYYLVLFSIRSQVHAVHLPGPAHHRGDDVTTTPTLLCPLITAPLPSISSVLPPLHPPHC